MNRILIVDDEIGVRELLTDGKTHRGFGHYQILGIGMVSLCLV